MKPPDLPQPSVAAEPAAGSAGVRTAFPPGHYHSPVVDPAGVAEYYWASHRAAPPDLPGISIDLPQMRRYWRENLGFIQARQFPELPARGYRFYHRNATFSYGDAIILRSMLGAFRPHQVIEVGAGFSTACMLDTADELGLDGLKITAIDPYPERVKSLLRPGDEVRLTILESTVQETSISRLTQLEANDILFIDSSHVIKTGSDVHFLLFNVLPNLASGVLVHVHDCPYPFEYPPEWVFEENYSWNEAYGLRAFLSFNERFQILFWGSLFARCFRADLAAECPDFFTHPGSSIWLIRCG